MLDNPTFADILRRKRYEQALSREALAAQIGCDSRTIARWESGQALPRPYYLQRLLDILGTNVQELQLTSEKTEKPNAINENNDLAAKLQELEDRVRQVTIVLPNQNPSEAIDASPKVRRIILTTVAIVWLTIGSISFSLLLLIVLVRHEMLPSFMLLLQVVTQGGSVAMYWYFLSKSNPPGRHNPPTLHHSDPSRTSTRPKSRRGAYTSTHEDKSSMKQPNAMTLLPSFTGSTSNIDSDPKQLTHAR